MSSIYSPRLKCGVCADLSILYSHCKQCGNLCENCSGLHSKGNAFKNHNVVSLTFSDEIDTSSIKMEPSIQLDLRDNIPVTTCIIPPDVASTSTSAPTSVHAPSTSNAPKHVYVPLTSNAPKPVYGLLTSNAPKPGYVLLTSNAPKPGYVPLTSNAPKPSYVPLTSIAPKPFYVPSTSNAPKPVYVPSTSNAPKPFYAPSTLNAPAPGYAPLTSNAPTPGYTTSTNTPNTSTKKGVKRKAASVTMKEIEKVACPKHTSKTVDLCCQDCNQAICSQCLISSHTGHRIGDITDFFGNKRAMIESDLDLIQSHIQQREDAKQQLVEELGKLEQASESVMKDVKDFIEKMRTTILNKAEEMKATTKETKKMITSRIGDFVKEIKKLEILRKKCQDELDAKDLSVVLFRKVPAFSLDTYENLPSSFKITPPAFKPDQYIMESFGTIVSATIQEEPIAFRSPTTPIKMALKKKIQKSQSSMPLPVPTATAALAQNHQIIKDAVKALCEELGMDIVKK
ncbi:uncharacterized protein LOC134246533 [Saccostrea cucullata]|uniref:uncharacterized protein LOC134246533 n=1 Tax=Saccostrea cuccullata TaxID=36930 RepID=UPI002ED399CD